MNPVVHFEMPYSDGKRLADFYSSVFGWQMQAFGDEMGNYELTSTTETDQQTMHPTTPGTINGGFFPKEHDSDVARVVIAVDDVKAAMKSVEGAGGKILDLDTPGEPIEIPGVGLYAVILDTEGNSVGLLQPTMPG